MIDTITDDQITDAAEKYLLIHHRDTLEVRDVYDTLIGKWKGYRGRKSAHRAVTLHRIARVLQCRGWVVVDHRGGYAIYRKGGDDNNPDMSSIRRMDCTKDPDNA